ncbi:MAG: uroporphyrinogen decarboxylase (URO-D) [Oscillospiraceae bacterium]|nr:uroporphyrinogen decarboxylase (URO-D) [Oscillospiraceae bacterium]
MTPKERYLALVNGEKTDGFVNQYEFIHLVFSDPLMNLEKRIKGGTSVCPWGVTFKWREDEVAATPYITEETKVCKDITEWRDYVHAPSLDVPEEAWEPAKAEIAAVDRDQQLVGLWCHTGVFERFHFLMGFEDALCNLLVEPESCHELLEYITDWRIDFLSRCIDRLDLDAVFFHDDWGSKYSTFLSPEVWREFFKPCYERIYGYIRSRGLRVIHHADSYCATIAEDMADLGIETWQGVLPTNNIPELKKALGGRMILMGGFDSGILDREDATEEEMRAHVAEVIKECGADGGWIPCITNGDPALLHPGRYEIVTDEIAKQSKVYFG